MIIDETGKTYGRLTVIELGPPDDGAKWKCKCSCGTVANIAGSALRRGHARSCGCLRRELSVKRAAELGRRIGPLNKLSQDEIDSRLREPRKCSRCKKVKGPSEFGALKSLYTDLDNRRTACKKCQAESVYRWKARNPEESSRRMRKCLLQMRYGITEEDYEEMLQKQDKRCAICGRAPTKAVGRLHIDHNHATGLVRGLLCVSCNMLIGMAKESITTLQSAIDYLKQREGPKGEVDFVFEKSITRFTEKN